MWNPESPFYVKPRLSADLLGWGWKFHRAATQAHVDRAAPVLRDLHLASRDCYREWAALWGNDFGLTERGMLMLCNTEHGLEEEVKAAEHARRLGIAAEVLTPAATAELEPNLRMAIAGSVYFPHGLPSVARAADGGACARGRAGRRSTCRTTPASTGWRATGGRIEALRTDRADGADSRPTNTSSAPASGRRSSCAISASAIPMQAGKGYSLTLESPASLPRVCAILSEARVAMTPMGSALRFAGTMELTGIDEGINPARVRGIVNSVARYFPDITPAQLRQATVRFGPAPLLAGWPALRRPRRAIRQSLGRHRARDDGHEPRTDHRQADGRNSVRRAAFVQHGRAESRPLCVTSKR